jgi:hypothetical protein
VRLRCGAPAKLVVVEVAGDAERTLALLARPEPKLLERRRRGHGRSLWGTLSRPMEAARFERTVRTESSEIFAIYGGARRLGRIDLHYGRFEVHGTLLLEVDLTDDEMQQIIDQIDEELVQTHDPEREDFLVTVFKSEELGFYSDEYEGEDDAGEEEEEDR